MSTNSDDAGGVTGRDSYIIEQALVYAFHLMGDLPETYRNSSDRYDMLRLIRHAYPRPEDREMLIATTGYALEHLTGRPLSLVHESDKDT